MAIEENKTMVTATNEIEVKVPLIRSAKTWLNRCLMERKALRSLNNLIRRKALPYRNKSKVGMLDIKSIQPHFINCHLFFAFTKRMINSIKKKIQMTLSIRLRTFETSSGSLKKVSAIRAAKTYMERNMTS